MIPLHLYEKYPKYAAMYWSCGAVLKIHDTLALARPKTLDLTKGDVYG